MLAERFDVDADLITQLAQAYKTEPTAANLEALLHASEPTRQELLRRLNHIPSATHLLVAMRSDLLKTSKNNEPFVTMPKTQHQQLSTHKAKATQND